MPDAKKTKADIGKKMEQAKIGSQKGESFTQEIRWQEPWKNYIKYIYK